jgi:hypothetical protein
MVGDHTGILGAVVLIVFFFSFKVKLVSYTYKVIAPGSLTVGVIEMNEE